MRKRTKLSPGIGAFLLVLFTLPAALALFTENLNNVGLQSGNIAASIPGFVYTKQVTISPATPFADYVLKFELNSTFNYAACQADGDDIRFYTSADSPLYHWTEKWNIAGRSIIWVKIPTIGTTSIKMAFGNTTIGSGVNGPMVFPLFDDFSGTKISTTLWTVENDSYSYTNVTAGKAMLRSAPPSKTRMTASLGFSDTTIVHGGTSTTTSNCVQRGNEAVTTMLSATTFSTTWKLNRTWSTIDYRWVSTASASFTENDTLLGTHTTNIPTTALPVLFFCRGMYYGPGSHWGAVVRSKTTFGPGYEVRTFAYYQYDYRIIAGCLDSKITVDWVFVRKLSATECASWLSDIVSSYVPRVSDFSRVENIRLSPATPFADYIVPIRLNASFNYAACQVDGDDIRFFDSANIILSFWTEKWNRGSESLFWVKIPLGGTSGIKMAFGNLTIGSGSNGVNTFPLFDDFSAMYINSMLWTVENDTYSTVSIVSGKVHIRSLPPNPTRMSAILGFCDTIVVHGGGSTTTANAVHRGNNGLTTERSGTATTVTSNLNKTWSTVDYKWVNTTLATFSENDSLLATQTTNVPTTSIPITFLARGMQWGPGTTYGGVLRSMATFGPGYEFRGDVYYQYDYRTTYPCIEVLIDADWLFVRQCAAVETVATFVPRITVLSPVPGMSYSSSTISLTVTVSDDNVHKIWYVLDGGAPVILSANTTITVADGSHTITYSANDTNGNTVSSALISFIVDATSPVVNILSPVDGQTYSNNTVALTYTIVELSVAKIWYTINGTGKTIITGNTSLTLPNANYVVAVSCNDTLGNEATDTHSFRINYIPPPPPYVVKITDLSRVENVQISPATPITNYTIRLNLGTTFNYASCQPDGDDVRFFDTSNVLLNYWVEKWNQIGQSIIWIRIPTAGTSSIKMAFGNNTMGSGSNGRATFALFDDFSGGSINSTIWTIETDTYSTATIVSGKAHIRSLPTSPTRMLAIFGFTDTAIAHGGMSTTTTNGLFRNDNSLFTTKASVTTATASLLNFTWSTIDYRWINSSLVTFSENETMLATHTTNVPTSSLPAAFITRGMYWGPGTHYGAVIRSKSIFGPGYEIRSNAYYQYDYKTTTPCAEAIVDVDWMFIRQCVAVESVATIAPSISVINPVQSSVFGSTSIAVDFSATDDNLDAVWYKLDGGASIILTGNTTIPVTNGAHILTIFANDTNGNAASVSRSFSVDTLAPVLTVISPVNGTIFTSTTIGLSFTVSDLHLDSAWFELDGGSPFTLYTNISITTGQGAHTIVFRANDTLGHEVSVTRTFMVDTISPVLTVASPEAGKVYAAGTVSVTVTVVEANLHKLWYVLDGGSAIELLSNITITPGQGSHVITIHANDTAGHSASVSRSFIVDTIAPTITVDSPAEGQLISTVDLDLTLRVQDPNIDHIWYVLDGGAAANLPANTSIAVGVGLHEIVFHANDTAGNEETITRHFEVDLSAPVITIHSPTNGFLYASASVFLNVTVVDATLDTIWYVLDGGAAVTLSGNISVPVADGSHFITIYANDSTGKTASVARSFEVDTASPSLTLAAPVNAQVYTTNPIQIRYNAADIHLHKVWYTINGSGKTFLVGNTSIALVNGDFALTISCNDTIGHLVSVSIVFKVNVDSVSPSITPEYPSIPMAFQGDILYLNWTIDDVHPGTFQLRENGVLKSSGAFSRFQGISILAKTTSIEIVEYVLTSTDAFGNVNTSSFDLYIMPRISGIFLTAGNHKILDYMVDDDLYLDITVNHWVVLDCFLDTIGQNDPRMGNLPSDLQVCIPKYFSIIFNNQSAFTRGSGRIYYDQTNLGQFVNEADLVLLVWNATTGSWEKVNSVVNTANHYITFDMQPGALYIVAGKATVPFYIIILIILSGGLMGGIVATASYTRHKKKVKLQIAAKSGLAPKVPEQYTAKTDLDYAKRERLMRVTSPVGTAGTATQSASMPKGAALSLFTEEASIKKKGKVEAEEMIDFTARADSAEKMASEVKVEVATARCIVHKGAITGLSFTCKHCNTVYCMKCVTHLIETNEPCWTCKQPLVIEEAEMSGKEPAPETVGIFSQDVWQKLQELAIPEEIFDEVVEHVRLLPPDSRLKYLEDTFKEDEFDREV